MLLLKLLLTPLLTLAVSLAARLWGHRVSGWLTALPIVAGPIMAVLIFEQGAAFAIDVAIGTLITLPALAAYIVAFGYLAQRRSWPTCLAGAWAAFFATAAPLSTIPANAHEALAAAWAGLGVACLVVPNPKTRAGPAHVPRIEIVLRVGAAVALMLVITYGAQNLGASVSGLLLSFPIGGSVLPAFTRALHGVDATEHLLRGFITGLIPFPLFFYGLAAGLPHAHPVIVFAAALAVMLAAHFVVIVAFARREKRTFIFVADRLALTNPDGPILVIDTFEQPGRSFRVIPASMWSVENNLAISNMDFAEFAAAVARDGVFRGFPKR